MRSLSAALLAAFSVLPVTAATISYSARQDIATGFQQLTSIAVGDFNGDGKPDIAAIDLYDKRVVVYLNNGSGGFAAPISTVLDITNTTGALAVGDVNEDGKQDLIVGTVAGLQANYILLGKGDGTFAQAGTMPNSFGFLKGLLIDINGDKHLDFLAGGNGNLYVYLGDGKGNFTAAPTPQGAGSVFLSLIAGDFNRDDKIDFITGTYLGTFTPGELRFYPGVGDGTFGAPISFAPFGGNSPYGFLDSADFNNDGKRDLLLSIPSISAVDLGNGDGTFQAANVKQLIYPPQATVIPQPSSDAAPAILVADFDNSGTPDIATVNTAENRLYIALNDGTGTFSQSAPDFGTDLQPGTSVLMAADLNGDGLPDIVGSSFKTGTIQVFLSKLIKTTPTLTLTSSIAQSVPGTPVTLSVKVTGTGAVPSGTVVIADGSTPLGQVTLDATGQGSLVVSTLAAGQHSLTATYSGDSKFNVVNTSAALLQSVADFTFTLPTPSQTIAPGGSATYVVSIAPLGGLTGTANLSCSGLPSGYTCAAVTATLTAQTATATLSISPATHARLSPPTIPFHNQLPFAAALLPMGALLLSRRKRIHFAVVCSVAFTVLCAGLIGCSSSSNTTTPAYRGTSTFTITATTTVGSQPLSHQVTATLTVQ